MREDVSGSGWGTGADPVAAWPRIGPDDRTLPRDEAGSGARAERRDQAKSYGVDQMLAISVVRVTFCWDQRLDPLQLSSTVSCVMSSGASPHKRKFIPCPNS